MIKIDDASENWEQNLKEAKNKYKYQPELTPELDNNSEDFSYTTILEIALWKVNRYPTVTDELIDALNKVRKEPSRENAELVLDLLLSDEYRGYDLPMASTLLRFAAPNYFQIIDQRVYRFIHPEKDSLKLPNTKEEKISLYFKYLDDLHVVCERHAIDFKEADRILYQMDKNLNKSFPLHKKSKKDD
jgi:thermostable 8-oxoguanine DNA glycosylase